MAVPETNPYRLLTVLQSYAPDGKAQETCSQLIRQLEADGESETAIVLTLIEAIQDGLHLGSWPWSPEGGNDDNVHNG